MSNPGVIELVSTNIGGDNFRVEDNLGEAIHFHLNDIRIDLTCKEFLMVADKLRDVINSMVTVKGFNVEFFDELFLFEIAEMLPDLVEVKKEKIFLQDLQIDTFNSFNLPCIDKLDNSRVYKALQGNSIENDKHNQKNLINKNNSERLDDIVCFVNKYGYPYNNKFIILFNNQNIIRDGQHRAATLLFYHGNIEVPVLRLKFKDDKYNIKSWSLLRFLFFWTPWRIKKVLKKIVSILVKILKKIKMKAKSKVISVRLKIKF